MADGKAWKGLIDMINGGGMGAAGSRFEGGGLLSLIGNALGIKPYGYMDRLSEMRPQARPTGLPDLQPVIPISQRPVARPQNAGSPLSMFGGQEPNSSPMARYDQMPAEIGNDGRGMDFYQGRGPGRSPTGPRDNMDAVRAAFAQQFNALYALPGMDAYADQMRIDPSVIERAFNRWVANGGRF